MVRSKEIKLGIIGFSEGNGHPYSYSSIINGYNAHEFITSDWDVIYNYVKIRDEADFGIDGALITHVWSQNHEESEKLARVAKIENVVSSPKDMIGEIDGVIIARDDYECHFELAKIFLNQNIKVFVDKPLTLDLNELEYFLPFIEKGQLMTCSGMRYAKELDSIRESPIQFGNLKIVRGLIINSWEKYGIHLLDAISPIINSKAVSVLDIGDDYPIVKIKYMNGMSCIIATLKDIPPVWQLDFIGNKKIESVNIVDNFTAFKRTLYHFIKMCREEYVPIPPEVVMNNILILEGALRSKSLKKEILLSDLE